VNKLVIFLFLTLSVQVNAQIFIGKNGEIKFFSETPIEDISAVNNKVSAVFDASTNDLVFQLNITDFKFPIALMQEHFNENYLESDLYPKSKFIGRVVNIMDEQATVSGDLTIHGITNSINVVGSFIKSKNSVLINSQFIIKLKDYNIKIFKIVMYKIAEEIEVRVNIELIELK
jgi:polyisoprenoid-binding protein YceI